MRFPIPKNGARMKSQSSATSWAVVLMAATSVVLMICLYQIDNIVHGTLYDYGLQFSYSWAGPYWKLTQIGFTLGWLNIAVAFAVQLYNIRMKPKAEQPTTAIEKAWETWKIPEENAKEHKERKTARPPWEKPTTAPEPEVQEKKEEQQPEETLEKEPWEPQLPETE